MKISTKKRKRIEQFFRNEALVPLTRIVVKRRSLLPFDRHCRKQVLIVHRFITISKNIEQRIADGYACQICDYILVPADIFLRERLQHNKG